MGFKIKKTVNGETVWEPIKAKKYTASKTIEYTGALPIMINADGTALIDYRIYGNTVQNGTPTPENPIMPSGCGERTENLFDKDAIDTNNGYIAKKELESNNSTENTSQSNISEYIKISPNTDYYLYWGAKNTSTASYCLYDENKTFIAGYKYSSYGSVSGTTFKSGSNVRYIRFTIRVLFRDATILTEGSTAPTQYIPYGYKLPLTSAGQDVDIYLGEVETTRRIKKLVLTGEENPNVTDSTTESGTKVFSLRFNTIGMADILDYDKVMSLIQYPFFYSSHFKQKSNQGLYTDIKDGEMGANNASSQALNRWIIFGSSAYTTVESFKAYLAAQYAAGTPVTIWYVLAEPETGIVNEPLMKIGDYADTVSMEQAGVSIPTNKGSTVIDYDGTPKPSQMYVKYNSWSGWEDCAEKEQQNGAWVDTTEIE